MGKKCLTHYCLFPDTETKILFHCPISPISLFFVYILLKNRFLVFMVGRNSRMHQVSQTSSRLIRRIVYSQDRENGQASRATAPKRSVVQEFITLKRKGQNIQELRVVLQGVRGGFLMTTPSSQKGAFLSSFGSQSSSECNGLFSFYCWPCLLLSFLPPPWWPYSSCLQ